MIRYIVAILLFVHGMIHILGFAKAYNIGEIPQLSKHISKPMGIVWLLVVVLFVITTIGYLYKRILVGNRFCGISGFTIPDNFKLAGC
ncbi:MAG: hypothetical protein IPP71_19025 [Bacteroidetes bacterium]|nr:hypothetical protein [Bacteroidota bacterium]